MQLVHERGWNEIVPKMTGTSLLSDIELWRTILSFNGNLLKYAAPNIQSNIELVRLATSMDPKDVTAGLFEGIGKDLMANKTFAFEMLDIIEKCPGPKSKKFMIAGVLKHWPYDQEIHNRILQIKPDLAPALKRYQKK